MDSLTVNAYAKINLFLEVCEKRPDLYHNIESVMQSVTLCDYVTIKKADKLFLSNDKGLPNDEKNIALKAAKLFFEATGIDAGAEIAIQKNIPISAGLAGGSTDAAAVLKGLNQLYETKLTIDELCVLGSRLGADVPFCVKCGTFLTTGIGDVFTPCSRLPDCYIVISKIGEGVSTPFAYGEIDKMRNSNSTPLNRSENIVNALADGSMEFVCKNLYNVFEKVVCPIRPYVDEQKRIMLNHSALASMMSGSGPSVFGIFKNKDNAMSALRELVTMGCDAHVCTPL